MIAFRPARRGRRAPFAVSELARLLAERRLGEMLKAATKNEGGRPPQKTGSVVEPVSTVPTLPDLGLDKKVSALFELIEQRHGDRLWSVSELRSLGYVQAHECRPLGFELSRLVRAGGRLGPFVLRRVGEDRTGAIYAVSRAVTRGDSARAQRDTRASLRGSR